MTVHMIGFSESVLSAGTLQAIAPMPDPTITVNDDEAYVPDKYNQLVLAAAIVRTNAITRAQFRAPSLREMVYPEVSPQVIGANFDDPGECADFRQSPIQLVTNEGLEFWSDGGGDGTTAATVSAFAWLSDGKISSQAGKIFPVRATASIGLSSGKWVSGPLEWDQSLPVGTYDIVGMRAEGAGLLAARLVFIGDSAVTRPGCVGVSSSDERGGELFRMGAMGVFGTFSSITPPSVECTGTGGSSQSFIFDLVKRG